MIEIVTKFLKKYQILYLVIFLAIYWLIRLPLYNYNYGWDGEDGNGLDTQIFVMNSKYSDSSLYARIDGQEQYSPISGHPAVPYRLFALLGSCVNLFIPLENITDQQIILIIKIIVSTFQLLIYISFAFQLIKWVKNTIKRFISLFLLLLLSSAPISIYNSNEFQIDSFLGFIMIGIFFVSFKNYLQSKKKLAGILLLISSLFIGFGKNEWSIILLPSCVCILLIHLLIQKFIKKGPVDNFLIKIITIVVAGNLIGNLVSYLYNQNAYLSGINLIIKTVTYGTLSGAPSNVLWWDVFLTRIPFIGTNLILIIIIFSYIFKYIKRINYYHLFLFIYSFSLFIAFFISSWGNYSRYFAPSLIGLIYVFLLYFTNKKLTKINFTLISFLLISTCFYSYNLLTDTNVKSQNSNYFVITDNKDSNCLPLIDKGRVYRRKDIDFFHMSYGYAAAQEIVKKYNKEICK